MVTKFYAGALDDDKAEISQNDRRNKQIEYKVNRRSVAILQDGEETLAIP